MATSIVVLAAGLSTRYRRPKQLEPLGPHGETLFDYGLHDALGAGADRIVIVTRLELLPAFEEHMRNRWRGVPVVFALQQQPAGTERHAPWGTGHAVLASVEAVDGPFVVCNADDFYGREAWTEVVEFVRSGGPNATGRYGVVGYPLVTTLSSSGGVSRSICEADGNGAVGVVTEWHGVERTGGHIEGIGLDGRCEVLEPAAPVSMNLWGFTADVFGRLQSQFERFRRQSSGDDGAEFLLSQAIDEQLQSGDATLQLLAGGAGWFGLTHPADRAAVVDRLRLLSESGEYLPLSSPDSN